MAQFNKNLSELEIEVLFKFVKIKYVHHHDLQHEVVDHLACNIEELMIKNPQLTFDEALQKVYNQFPISGFTNLVAQKTKAMEKYWRTRFWQYYIGFFKLPRVLFTIGSVFILFKLLSIPSFKPYLVPIYYILFVLLLLPLFYSLRKSYYKKANQLLVIESYFKTVGFSLLFFNLNFYLIGATFKHPVTILLFSFLMIYSLVSAYAQLLVFPKMLIKELKQNYPYIGV